jgi:hypothetical protein
LKTAIRCVFALAFCSPGLICAGELRLERTLLPDAAPSSFAVGFSTGVNFCYDVVRGGVSYVWKGDFVDISSVRPDAGKAVSPVKLLGEVVYRESEYFPLRRNDPQRGVEADFKGYRLKTNAIEFIYEIDRCRVTEEVRPTADGTGLVREFRIEGARPGEMWWYVPGTPNGGQLEARGADRDGRIFRFDPAQSFLLEVRLGKAAS